MSAGSASPHTDLSDRPAAEEGGSEVCERNLERLIGVRSSKPTFYAAWREKSARLDRTIEMLERISAALCVAPEGPGALCEAVVEAAAHHFDARWAAMTLADGPLAQELPSVIMHSRGTVVRRWDDPPPVIQTLAARAVSARRLVVAAGDAGGGDGPDRRDAVGG